MPFQRLPPVATRSGNGAPGALTIRRVSLKALDIRPEYRSDRAVLAREFFSPCLAQASTYDRAVGYFQSSSLAVLADGLQTFVDAGGTVRIVASPRLNAADAEALQRGYEERQRLVSAAIDREVEAFASAPSTERARLELLAWLVAEGHLDLRLAIVVGRNSVGMYHEKLGLFADDEGNTVAFSGSANESVGGLVSNFESIDVFCSWNDRDQDRVASKRDAFERLWGQHTRGVEVFEFPEAARRRLIEFAPATKPAPLPDLPAGNGDTVGALFGFPTFPTWFQPRDYQKAAVAEWLAAGGRGVFAMATGSGKTLTALSVIVQVARQARAQEQPVLVVVSCPQKHLVTQWARDIESFGIDPLLCFEGAARWTQHADVMRSALAGARAPFGLWITTNATFISEPFQERLQAVTCPLMIVADEMHNLGAARARDALPQDAQFRLGLSATPERHRDEEGTRALFDYFGDPVFELSLAEAIERGILTRYRYEPVLVEFDDDEMEVYADLTGQLVRALSRGNGDDVDLLLFKRSRLIGGARRKLGALEDRISEHRNDPFSLVYCSDSNVNGTTNRQIEAVVELLGKQLEMRVAPYTYETSTPQRQKVLQLFEHGLLNALVAIRCLDEGVDVPATRRAYILASSTNPREYVQRRGRVLRRFPGKERADVLDFVAIPPEDALPAEHRDVERRLLARELERVLEFARSAENGPAAMAELLPLQERYGLLHL